MSMRPNLYGAGIRYGWRRLRGIWGSTRKEFGVREADAPLGAVRCRANEASASREGKGEEGHQSYDDSVVQHLL